MEKFIENFAEALEREGDIKMQDEFRSYEEWSSIAYLSVIAMMDAEYDTQIEEADFKKLRGEVSGKLAASKKERDSKKSGKSRIRNSRYAVRLYVISFCHQGTAVVTHLFNADAFIRTARITVVNPEERTYLHLLAGI